VDRDDAARDAGRKPMSEGTQLFVRVDPNDPSAVIPDR